MNTALQLLAYLMSRPDWELLTALGTILALSFVSCFLGMIAPQIQTNQQEEPGERWESLQELNGVRVSRRGV